MIGFLKKETWSPYLVGVLVGVLLTWLFTMGYQIGASSGIARIGALVEYAVAPSLIVEGTYFSRLLLDGVVFNWKVLFIVGLYFGSLLASRLSDEKPPQQNMIWKAAYGSSRAKRYCAAFIGGVLLMLGARLANGCTSGHAISGGAQLSVTSWAFMLAVFAVAIPVSLAMYRKNK